MASPPEAACRPVGAPGTVRSIVKLATAKNASVVLVAPTSRAAKRLAELTGHEACTLHRLLELKPSGEAKYDRDNPLDADLAVVDETSMMDVILANKLIKAIPKGRTCRWSATSISSPAASATVSPAPHRLPGLLLVRVRAPEDSGLHPAEETATLVADIVARRIADGTPEKRYGGRVFRVGDRITQLRCNYHKGQAGIFNGTVGASPASPWKSRP